MQEKKHTDAAQHNGRGYEVSDAHVKSISGYAIGLVIVCGVSLFLMALLLNYFRAEKKSAEPPMSPLAAQREAMPPEPRLQIQPEADWNKYKAIEDSLSQTYGWISREAGVVRLPVDRALELVAQRGLPSRAEDRGSRMEDGGARP